MSDDLVERLNRVAEFGGTHLNGLWTEAADEITRLRAELAESQASEEGFAMILTQTKAELAGAEARGYRRGIDQAAASLGHRHTEYMVSIGRNPANYDSAYSMSADAIRALGERE